MRSRQDITDIFSTYIGFRDDRFSGWIKDPKLRMNFENCLSQVSDRQSSKNFWSLYWHKQWQNKAHRLALEHLIAYLQESAYWATEKFTRFHLKQYKLNDCFQIAIATTPKALESFQIGRGTTLESFAKLFFKSTLANELRRAREIDVSSDWLLLRKLTGKQLIESLQAGGGLEVHTIERYRLAWMCFKQRYAEYKESGAQRLAKPTQQTWSEVANLYNQARVSQLSSPGDPIDAVTAEKWLLVCVRWARGYLYPSVASLNVPSPGYDSGEMQDNLSDGLDQSLVDQLLLKESVDHRRMQQQQLTEVLHQAIQQLKSSGATLLQLYYREGLRQKEIAKRLEIKQYTVSRQLTKVRGELLTSLIEWSQQTLEVELTPEIIETMGIALEEWLSGPYSQG